MSYELPSNGHWGCYDSRHYCMDRLQECQDGPASAAADFNSFRHEFGSIKELLKQIQQTKKPTIKGERDLGIFYIQTIDECAEFVHKHRQLTQNENTSNGRRNSFGAKVSNFCEKVTWPLE
ncbi:uncharacterized protein BP01DRAFT_381568 [Aspergillus saccharolyticus JOP 1030-1]|uniref:Uncharacterized protein n=1 Tax=Aspergillus saccharolyticus JOP 1030-1 TaxID=1450539 RepID=A0A318ZIB7_9EURO|nr:hypothetical protein BP01DRAFT_381568 [Aspergillus saccharolyticus JOP 1030-1]PYH46517.1 hypothetical protein BP01DRAFT_381568 [Aspergillus saccharolyticus JOP 1030-1]